MAVDMFLKLDGIDGESLDAKYKGEIDVESFSWGVGRAGREAAAKPAFQDFAFTTPVGSASSRLFLACASGDRIPTARLTVRTAGGELHELYRIILSDVVVSSYVQAASADAALPMEQVSLNFSKIEIDFLAPGPEGAAGLQAGWDLEQNSKIQI